jgi:hypothetical protein
MSASPSLTDDIIGSFLKCRYKAHLKLHRAAEEPSDDEEPLRLLASLCRKLQRQAGDADFFLDCRTAGRLLGVPHNTAWRWLMVLCADGMLRAGEKGSQAKHRASPFRYVAD